MINISLKHTLPAYQSSHYTGKVNCVRGGFGGALNREKVALPSTCLLIQPTRPHNCVLLCVQGRRSGTLLPLPLRRRLLRLTFLDVSNGTPLPAGDTFQNSLHRSLVNVLPNPSKTSLLNND